jgi:hypothetical protein
MGRSSGRLEAGFQPGHTPGHVSCRGSGRPERPRSSGRTPSWAVRGGIERRFIAVFGLLASHPPGLTPPARHAREPRRESGTESTLGRTERAFTLPAEQGLKTTHSGGCPSRRAGRDSAVDSQPACPEPDSPLGQGSPLADWPTDGTATGEHNLRRGALARGLTAIGRCASARRRYGAVPCRCSVRSWRHRRERSAAGLMARSQQTIRPSGSPGNGQVFYVDDWERTAPCRRTEGTRP